MQLTRLKVVLVQELRRLFAAEGSMGRVLERLRVAAEAEELKEFLDDVMEQATGHLHHLELTFRELGESAGGGQAESMRALLHQGEDQLASGGEPHVLDGAILVALSRVVHWKLATYAVLVPYAQRLGFEETAQQLALCLDDEKVLEERLGRMASTLQVESADEP